MLNLRKRRYGVAAQSGLVRPGHGWVPDLHQVLPAIEPAKCVLSPIAAGPGLCSAIAVSGGFGQRRLASYADADGRSQQADFAACFGFATLPRSLDHSFGAPAAKPGGVAFVGADHVATLAAGRDQDPLPERLSPLFPRTSSSCLRRLTGSVSAPQSWGEFLTIVSGIFWCPGGATAPGPSAMPRSSREFAE